VTATLNLQAVEIKAFVPAHDFALSQSFYRALGFEIPWSDDGLAYVRYGEVSFFLQAVRAENHAPKFMMHLLVENVNDWYAQALASCVRERFGVKIGELTDQPWRMRDFFVYDPTGVLWTIAQNTD
jgi:catechol 2,3-dioxygenase-like lactoylglutathione lyase family enzyme